ncbi:MAG: hypothetical protein AAF702_07285 [Chloroflexota bacterium]
MGEINLAPNHKQGLPLPNPILLAGGVAGYGEALFSGIDPASLGGMVVGPIMRYSSGGPEAPRVAESGSTYVLNSGKQNRGIMAVLKKYRAIWTRLGCSVIPQIADTQGDSLAFVAEKLTDAYYDGAPIAGIELLPPLTTTEQQCGYLVDTALRSTDLPILVKLPLNSAHELAEVAFEAGADCLVIGQPPLAALKRHQEAFHPDEPAQEVTVTAALGGQALFPLILHTLIQVAEQNLPCPLAASGGIHSVGHARQLMDAGASAIQLDGAIWVEPGLVGAVIEGLD